MSYILVFCFGALVGAISDWFDSPDNEGRSIFVFTVATISMLIYFAFRAIELGAR